MSRKGFRPEDIIAKLPQADILPGQRQRVPEVVKVPREGQASRLPGGSRAHPGDAG